MPPKAKAKAAAVLRRPAGHPRVGALRRPAGRGEVRSPWAQGLEQELWKVSPTELGPGSLLAITEADYFGAPVKFAGEVTQLVIEHGESTVLMKALGTDHEGLLRAHSARPLQLFKGHICPPGCGKLTSGEYLIHCVKGRRLNKEQEEGWTSNLEGHRPPAEEGDEMAELRERSHRLRGGDPGGGSTMRQGEVPPPGRLEAEASVDKKRKKKDKKEKKRTKEVSEGRHPAVAAQKELRDLYAGTALDPKERIRRRILGKAQALPRRLDPGGRYSHASGAADDLRRGVGRYRGETGRPPLLPERPLPPGHGGPKQGDVKSSSSVGSSPSRESGVCSRHHLPEAKGPGGGDAGHKLECSAQDGGATSRERQPCQQSRTTTSPARGLQRSPSPVEDSSEQWVKGRWKGQGQESERTPRTLEEGREKRGCRKGKGSERK